MKKANAYLACAVLLSAVAAIPVSASVLAQVGASSEINGGLQMGSGTDANANVDVNAGVRADGNGSGTVTANPSYANKASSSAGDASLTAKARANLRSAVKAVASSSASTSAGAYNTMNGGVGSSSASSSIVTFVLTRDDVAVSSSAPMSATTVSSDADFSAYARSLMTTDPRVSRVEAGSDHVSVFYDQPAMILGIIPATATVESTVDASGNVTVTYPWWYGMFVKDDTEAQFQTDLSDTAGTIARGEATTTLSSTAKARLVNALQSIMKTHYEATVNASTSASTTG